MQKCILFKLQCMMGKRLYCYKIQRHVLVVATVARHCIYTSQLTKSMIYLMIGLGFTSLQKAINVVRLLYSKVV